jgi:hypothetical protein
LNSFIVVCRLSASGRIFHPKEFATRISDLETSWSLERTIRQQGPGQSLTLVYLTDRSAFYQVIDMNLACPSLGTQFLHHGVGYTKRPIHMLDEEAIFGLSDASLCRFFLWGLNVNISFNLVLYKKDH